MRLCYPNNGPPIVVLPSVSLQNYDWCKKSVVQKAWIFCISGFYAFFFVYIACACAANRILSSREFIEGVSKLIYGMLIPAVLVLLVVVTLNRLASKYPPTLMHEFYQEWAWLRTGTGKGGCIRFFLEEITSLEIEKVFVKDRSFYLATFILKPTLNTLGKPGKVKIGILAKDEDELQPLLELVRSYGASITVGHKPPLHSE